MTISEELDKLYRAQIRLIAEEVANLFTKLLKASPVKTGNFRSDWKMDRTSTTSWVIENDVEYAEILWDGRRLVNGKAFGSEQWPEGGDVMLERANRIIHRKLNKIRI